MHLTCFARLFVFDSAVCCRRAAEQRGSWPAPAGAMTNGTDPETGGQSGQRPKHSSGIPGMWPHDVAQPRAMVHDVLRLILLLLRRRAG